MSGVGTAFNWVQVTGGVWTRIWQGPLVAVIPLQALELGTTAASSTKITFSLDGYSAAFPFYLRVGGSSQVGFVGNPPVGHSGSYAYVLGYHTTPWVEFWIRTNVTCFAHIAVL